MGNRSWRMYSFKMQEEDLELMDKFDKMARFLKVPRSVLIRAAIRYYLDVLEKRYPRVSEMEPCVETPRIRVC